MSYAAFSRNLSFMDQLSEELKQEALRAAKRLSPSARTMLAEAIVQANAMLVETAQALDSMIGNVMHALVQADGRTSSE